MKNRTTTYHIQTNLEGGFDIIQEIKNGKIIAHTDNEEAAKEVIKILTSKQSSK